MINWDEIKSAYAEMQRTGKQAIITLPKIDKKIQSKDGLGSFTLRICEGGEYFVYGVSMKKKLIFLLNMKEQLFGDFKEEIRYDDYADTVTAAEKAMREHYVTEFFDQVVSVILDRSQWTQCHYAQVIYSDEKDTDRMYLVKEGERPNLAPLYRETGRFLQFDVEKREFVFVEEDTHYSDEWDRHMHDLVLGSDEDEK